MVNVDPEFMLNTEPHPVAGMLGVWGDMREDGKDKLVREFEN